MQSYSYLPREAEPEVVRSLDRDPVVALVGPRQCGKSTLARHVLRRTPGAIILDLELPSDLRKLDEPELFLREHADRLVCIDEIQCKPDLFPILRALVDMDRRPGRFLVLGSASQDALRQGGETLAGRIHVMELTPLRLGEVAGDDPQSAWRRHWWRGGFPPAYLAPQDDDARTWMLDFIQTYCSRDIPRFGFAIPAPAMGRFCRMVAHFHGGILNSAKIGQSLDVSHTTVRRYLDLLEQSFMVRRLLPLEVNTKKRLVKSPKIYVRDSGLLHALLEIGTSTDLFGHPAYGASWEGWCIEQICPARPGMRASFYRDSAGAEIDLVLESGRRRLAFEFRASLDPSLTRGNRTALDLISPEQAFIVCPTQDPGYPVGDGVRVCGIAEAVAAARGF